RQMTGLWNPKGVVELDRLFPLKNECAARLLSDVSTGEAWDYLQNNAHNRSYFDKFIPYYLRSYARPRNDALRQIPELDPFLELGLPEDLKDKILNIDDCYSPYAYGYEKSDLTIFDNLAAALYGEMVFEYGNSPPFGNISQVRRWAKPCF
ncbi:hypothetical protein, partial [Acinetobacter baumannii]|uniref:hypothetical protein n=1 Tax=Acinetobacter baumannii TaxID=470 RepID=UPI00144AE7CC